ncbi:hypothetical protein ACFFV7_44400 [Nonomuraea spiralis]|uniref:Uncharacterized protein n=1 Tax=Nonomuraea spiralis TaxID=46182 RepID=A0ABV5IUT3_9ACTN|nr:hypothetical protein [Nonomuraea spiralis]
MRCRYVTGWADIKRHGQLSVDAAEKAAFDQVAQGCPNTPLAQPS